LTSKLRLVVRRACLLATVLAVAISARACTQLDNALASIPAFSFLRNAPFFDPYEYPRPAPPGSVPFSTPAGEVLPPLEATEVALNAFAGTIRNPYAYDDTAALRVGRVMYDRHCTVCHGAAGKGDGPILNKPGVTGKFPFAPNLGLPITVARSDGYLYAIIRAGRGLMPAYGPRTTHLERWAMVNYVRELQRRGGAATPSNGASPNAPAAVPTPAPATPTR
jgi:mono/diheme cytochrome c family protein